MDREKLLTELEEQVRRAHTSEAQLRAIVHTSADAILIVDADGTIQFANPAAESLFASEPGALSGQPFGLPLTVGFVSEVDIATRGRRALVAEMRVTEILWNDQPAVVASLRDITAKKTEERRAQQLVREQLARAAAEEAERRARFLVDAGNALGESLDHAVTLTRLAQVCVSHVADWCVIDVVEPDGRLSRVAVAQADPTGEKLARELGELLPEEFPLPFEPEVLRTGTSAAISNWPRLIQAVEDERYRSVLERMAPHHAVIVPMRARGRNIGALTLIGADSALVYRKADTAVVEEVARYAASAIDNSRLYQEAQRSNIAKTNFLAMMSHELRTPLNAIIGYSDLMLMGIPAPVPLETRSQIERVCDSARHLLKLIEGVLAFSRSEAGHEPIDVQAVNLVSLLNEVAAVIEPLADERQLGFGVVLRAQTEIRTDPDKLRQILLNLLANAVKFTPDGSLELEVVAADDWTHFHVHDSGVGIAPEYRERIFDPFWQVEQGRTRPADGTGLGLTVARRFATLLGGNLVVQSTPGCGSTFTLQLPNAGPTTFE